MTDRWHALGCVAVVSLLLGTPSFVTAQESRSSQLASELATVLDGARLDSIAARIAGDEYVGALYFSGSQLLVVKARYMPSARIDGQVAERDYRGVYIELNSASIPDSKMLVSDAGVNGLRPRPRNDEPFDTVDMGGKSYAFDGEWGDADLSEGQYWEAFRMGDAEYTRMLEALIAQAKAAS